MSVVRVERDGGIAVVTLDDPDRRNALTQPMVDELVGGFEDLEAGTEIGAVVVTGAGPAFCAGADLSRLGGSGESALRGVYEGFLRVARSPLPTIAAVNGPAVGAGMNLALCCDVRLAARSARFDTRFVRLGLHPGGGHTWMMRRFTGAQTAAATVLFGEVLDGEAAERHGLVWRCVDDGALLDEARAMAARAAEAPHELLRRVKQTMLTMDTITDHAEAVTIELKPQLWSIEQPEFAERLKKMREKR